MISRQALARSLSNDLAFLHYVGTGHSRAPADRGQLGRVLDFCKKALQFRESSADAGQAFFNARFSERRSKTGIDLIETRLRDGKRN